MPLEGFIGKGRIWEMERPGFVLLPSPYSEFWVDGPLKSGRIEMLWGIRVGGHR